MRVLTEILIEKPKKSVWSAITDFKHWSNMISGISDVDVLAQPESGVVGLKWKETRMMFGKEASETMWITEAIDNEYYCTRAESHGSVYITKMSLIEKDSNTLLSMSFTVEPQTLMVKLVSTCMGVLIKNSMKKTLRKDLDDIKKYVEQKQPED